MADLQKEAMLDCIDALRTAEFMTPKGTWCDGHGSKAKPNPRKLARRIQMSGIWKNAKTAQQTECGIYMPPKKPEYLYTPKDLGMSASTQYWSYASGRYESKSAYNGYWWRPEDKMPETPLDVAHAHAHQLSGDKGHGGAFAQAFYEILISQWYVNHHRKGYTRGDTLKKEITKMYEDFGIIKGRNRKITKKPLHSLEDYKKAAPTARSALEELIKGL